MITKTYWYTMGLFLAALVLLKLTGIIALEWTCVLLPLWIGVTLILIALALRRMANYRWHLKGK